MSIWNHYYIAQAVPDALEALANSHGLSRLIAGGTDLLLDLQQGRLPPVDTLVDVSQIPEMLSIEERNDRIFIGASVPLSHLIASPFLQRNSQALIDAVSLIGGPQVRNTATLGGNVAHALPAADGTIALLALDALAQVVNAEGSRLVSIEDLFLGPGKSALDPKKEILTRFVIEPLKPGQGSAFRRVMRPQGVAIAILNMAVWIERAGQRIQDIRISCGPAGPKPLRARLTERGMRGKIMDQSSIDSGLQIFLSEAHFRTSPHRATEEYRRHLASCLLEETVSTAWSRAGQGSGWSL